MHLRKLRIGKICLLLLIVVVLIIGYTTVPGTLLLVVFYNEAHQQSQRNDLHISNDSSVQRSGIISTLPASLSVRNLSSRPGKGDGKANKGNVKAKVSKSSYSVSVAFKSTQSSTISDIMKNITKTIPASKMSDFKSTLTAAKIKTTVVNHISISDGTSVMSTANTTPRRTHYYVCPEPTNGGIGNVMFEFASAYAVAKEKNMTVLIPPLYKLNGIFSVKADIRKDYKTICKGAKGRRAAFHIRYDANLTNFEANRDYRIGIYLQSWKYFDKISQDIRNQFKFTDHLRNKAKIIILKIVNKHKFKSRTDVILVGIHIRRGDFLKNKFGYTVATPEYLRKAMKYFTQKFINVFFIVCTNDLKWTKEHMPPAINVEYVTGNSAQLDMCILTECDHTIITVGTFGWWAAWLNDKGKTVYFKWPAKEGSKLRKHFSKDYTDYFPPNWIGL